MLSLPLPVVDKCEPAFTRAAFLLPASPEDFPKNLAWPPGLSRAAGTCCSLSFQCKTGHDPAKWVMHIGTTVCFPKTGPTCSVIPVELWAAAGKNRYPKLECGWLFLGRVWLCSLQNGLSI